MSLNVLISGGGIAGPALAVLLGRFGHKCTVVERSPSLRANGQQIDMREQAVQVVEYMGLMEEVRKIIVDERGLQFVDVNGKQKAVFPKTEGNAGKGFTSEFEMMRGDLCKVLYEASYAKCTYRFGTSVESFVNGDDKVTVKLSDGTEGDYDLLVAADGQDSRIRKSLLGEEANAASMFPLRVSCSYYTIKREPGDEDMATVCQSPGRRVMSTRYHTKSLGQGYLLTMASLDEMREAMSKGQKSQKDAFAGVFRGAGWQAERLIQAMYDADDFYAHELMQVRSPTWFKGRVVLLGDAGYAPSPLTGMGTSLALIGAYTLAGELSRCGQNIEKGLHAYEETLRPFVEETQELPKGVPDIAYLDSKWAIRVMNGILGVASTLKLNKVFENFFHRGRDKWKLPPPPSENQSRTQ